MKTPTLVLAGLVLGTGAACLFLVHRNRALLADLAQLHEQILRLESVQAENAELKVRLSRERAVAWEMETLRQQAKDVHRLRAADSELLRLRRENQEMTLRLNQLTNHLDELAQQNEQLRQAAKAPLRTWVVRDGKTVGIPVPQTTWAEPDSIPPSHSSLFQEFHENNAVANPGAAPPSSDVFLPPTHAPSNQSCVSCHARSTNPESAMKPQLLGWIDVQMRSK